MTRPTRINPRADIMMRETKQTFTYNHTDVLALTIRTPVVRVPCCPQAARRINAVYRAEAAGFFRYAADTLYEQAVQEYHDAQNSDYPFRPYEAVSDTTVTLNRSCHFSSYTDQYQYTGGAHGSTVRSSHAFALRTGRELALSSLFPPGFNWKGFLLGRMIAQADLQMQQEPIYFDDYRSLMVQNFNSSSFYLSNEGLNLYYQQYEIAPYSTGIPVFTISYEAVGWRPTC